MRRAAHRLSRLALACALCLVTACSIENAKDAALGVLDWLDRILPVPEPAKPRELPKDDRPIRPPLLEIDHGIVKYQGRTLPFPGSASVWAEAMGPFWLHDAAPPDLRNAKRPMGCDLSWDALGMSASGRWSLTAEGDPQCMLRHVEILLDADEKSLMHPLSDLMRKYYPKHDFPGTLRFERIRMDKRMEWTALQDKLRIGSPDLECPWTTSTYPEGPRISMRCERKGTNLPFRVLLVRAWQGKPRLVMGLSFEIYDPND